MSTDNSWISGLLDNSLSGEQSELLAEEMSQDSGTLQQVLQELDMSDLMARTLDPARGDDAFMSSLDTLLDAGMGGDFGDGGDGDIGPDAPGPEGDFTGPDVPIDPGASGGLSTAAKVWTGIVLSSTLAGGVVVYDQLTEEPEPTVIEQPALPPAPAAPAYIDIVAEADAALHRGDDEKKIKTGDQPYFHVHTIRDKKVKCGVIIRFDLKDIPDDADSIHLRLFSGKVGENMKPISIRLVKNDEWDEATITGGKALWGVKGSPLATFSPVEGEYTNIDLTDIVLSEKTKDGKITIRIEVPGIHKDHIAAAFATREFPETEQHPVLRITPKQEVANKVTD